MSKIRVKKEFKTVVIEESSWEVMFSSAGKSHGEQIENTLDHYEQEGWGLVSLENNCYRTLLFWDRNRTTITLSRPIALSGKGAELCPSSLGH